MAKHSLNVGVIGTSWWVESMYLPALVDHPLGRVTAICGRRKERAQQLANSWQIPNVYTDYQSLLDSGEVDALIVATPNDSHHPITLAALDKEIHVLCEKPLALNYGQAQEMAEKAQEKGVTTMTPFTYRFMPTNRYIKELLGTSYLGDPYHFDLRYYASYGRDPSYSWRFDKRVAGSGALGDIGSHFLYLAYWFFGEVEELSCTLQTVVGRPLDDPDGNRYIQADDAAFITLKFKSGVVGRVTASTIALETTKFGQVHLMEFHGSEGSLYSRVDWDNDQWVKGSRVGQDQMKELPLPDHIWGDARSSQVHATYKDIFRKQEHMARQFVTAAAHAQPTSPDFADGAYVQKLVDTALQSNTTGKWTAVR